MYPHVTQPEVRLRSSLEELLLRRQVKAERRRRKRRRNVELTWAPLAARR